MEVISQGLNLAGFHASHHIYLRYGTSYVGSCIFLDRSGSLIIGPGDVLLPEVVFGFTSQLAG